MIVRAVRAGVTVLVLLLCACATQPPGANKPDAEKSAATVQSRYAVTHDFAPLRPISPDEVSDAVPKPDPILAVGNMSP